MDHEAVQQRQETLQQENAMLRFIVECTIWMARRYANGRCTYAPQMFNEALQDALDLNVKIQPLQDPTFPKGQIYARDGQFGEWVPTKRTFAQDAIPLPMSCARKPTKTDETNTNVRL